MALARPQVTKTQNEAETLNTAGVEATATAAVVEPEVVSAAASEAVASSEPMTEKGVEATQAVAVAEPAEQKAVSVTEQRTNAMAQFSQDQAASGYEGLDLTGHDSGGFFSVSYPNLLTGLACGRTMTFGRRAGMLAATGQA